jgi:hypothetical protein
MSTLNYFCKGFPLHPFAVRLWLDVSVSSNFPTATWTSIADLSRSLKLVAHHQSL